MRHIEAKARRQQVTMYWAAEWLETDPDWYRHKLHIQEPGTPIWARRAVRKQALRRARLERLRRMPPETEEIRRPKLWHRNMEAWRAKVAAWRRRCGR